MWIPVDNFQDSHPDVASVCIFSFLPPYMAHFTVDNLTCGSLASQLDEK